MIVFEHSVLWSFLILTTCLFSMFLSGIVFQKKEVDGALELSFFLFTVALYGTGYALEVTGHTLQKILDGVKIELFWSSFTAPAFLLFAMRFIRKGKIPYRLYALIYTLPLLLGITAFSLEKHELIYRNYWISYDLSFPVFHFESGLLHTAQIFYLIAVSLIAEALLLKNVIMTKGILKQQALMILIGSFIPTLHAIIFPNRIAASLDTQPLVLAVTGLLIAVSLFRYGLLEVVKTGRSMAVDNLNDPMVILDSQGIILDINDSGRESDLLRNLKIGREMPDDRGLGKLMRKKLDEADLYAGPTKIDYSQSGRHYAVSLSPITGIKRKENGFVFMIHETTENRRRMSELEEKASRDSLTGIYNRRHWMQMAREELDKAGKSDNYLGLMIFDLDHFKNINDTYGHPCGDEVLKQICSLVGGKLRDREILGRYGGEEFTLVCRHTDPIGLFQLGERLRRLIESHVVKWEGNDISVTASFGLYAEKATDSSDLEDLLSRADKALYEAKNRGRNACVLYGDKKTPQADRGTLVSR